MVFVDSSRRPDGACAPLLFFYPGFHPGLLSMALVRGEKSCAFLTLKPILARSKNYRQRLQRLFAVGIVEFTAILSSVSASHESSRTTWNEGSLFCRIRGFGVAWRRGKLAGSRVLCGADPVFSPVFRETRSMPYRLQEPFTGRARWMASRLSAGLTRSLRGFCLWFRGVRRRKTASRRDR